MTSTPLHANPARPTTPAQAWQVLREGNARFISDSRAHPHQDVHKREELAAKQAPFAIFFGCADSRVAAEIIFDQGLGDLFVVRTAGHVVDPSVLGSLEFGVVSLGAPLIVILGHDSCGAVTATLDAARTGLMPPGFLRDIVERVMPSVLTARAGREEVAPDEVEREHVMHTARLLADRSRAIGDRVADGRLAIVGAQYDLADGEARLVGSLGDIGLPASAATIP
ncbi:MAG: carbonic anhydrase [Nostocoides sp.]